MSLLLDLSPSQRIAIEKGDAPTLVIAGPGSGKTRTLIAKVASILEATAGGHECILALTFTNKAAMEMLNRLSAESLDVDNRCHASTFHSFACDLLRQHGHLIGLSPDFALVVNDNDREAFIQSSEPQLKVFSRQLKDAVESVGKLGGNLQTLVSEHGLNAHFASLVERYVNALTRENRVDMNLVLYSANQLLASTPAVQELVRLQYPYVCVDEFQDSNMAQMLFLQMIADQKGARLFVVADDDQLIYGWNGASTERIDAIRSIYSPAYVQLAENYRCAPEILSLANALIQQNRIRNTQKLPLVATKALEGTEPVRCFAFPDEASEVGWVCGDIANRVASGEARIAILGRTRAVLESYCKELNDRKISAVIVTRCDDFRSPHMQWLQSVLKFSVRPDDAIISHQVHKLSSELSGVALSPSKHNGLTALASWQLSMILMASIDGEVDAMLDRPLTQLVTEPNTFLSWCDGIVECFARMAQSGFEAHSDAIKSDLAAWAEICDELQRQFGDRLDLATFVQELDMRSKTVSPPADCIQCFTVHGAKGLEFKHVYVVGMYDGGIPYYKAVKKGANSAEMEEERRGCFVAITRAESTLTMSYAISNRGYSSEPSRFLRDMGFTWN